MDYLSAFDISGTGMSVEKLRLDVTAINLANAHTTKTLNGKLYKPLYVKSAPIDGFGLSNMNNSSLPGGVEVLSVEELNTEPRMAYEPGHPDADDKGYVAYPGIDPVSEMINLITSTRAFEANVRAMNAAKTMALKALEIGGTP